MDMTGQASRSRFDPFTRTTIRADGAMIGDFYHRALRMSWPAFVLILSAVFLCVNVMFAALYMVGGHAINGARPGSFEDHFFFSVQTLATIGYGVMSPRSLYGNILVTCEAMIGMFGIGTIAALAFARFSLPSARVRFSDVAVITQFNGTPTLMLRAANERTNALIAARVQVSLLRQEMTQEGLAIRRFYNLNLERAETPIFTLSWLIMHRITEASPLFGLTAEEIMGADFALLVSITGLDETVSQSVHARRSYFNADIKLNHRFRDMLEFSDDGNRVIDLRRMNAIEPDSTPKMGVGSAREKMDEAQDIVMPSRAD